MDEQNNLKEPPMPTPAGVDEIQQTEPTQSDMPPVQPDQNQTASEPGSNEYGGFLIRFIAAIIDGVIVSFGTAIITFPLNLLSGSDNAGVAGIMGMLVILIQLIVYLGYWIGLTSKKGATLGKMALGLRVQKKATGENLSVVDAFLREVIGKFVSSLVFGLGYLWIIWDPEKQGWHDKIAGSVVVKVNK